MHGSVISKSQHCRVRLPFKKRNTPKRSPKKADSRPSATSRTSQSRQQSDTMTSSLQPLPGIPSLFTELSPIQDSLVTKTSQDQDKTVKECLPFLKGRDPTLKSPFSEHGVPQLYRHVHKAFLIDALSAYPANFVGLDASRPWMVYWALTGLSILGEDVTKYRKE